MAITADEDDTVPTISSTRRPLRRSSCSVKTPRWMGLRQ